MEDRLGAVERRTVSGIACTSEERSLFDEMRRAVSLREAVVAMDMAAAAELTSIARMRSYLTTRSGWLGVPRARAALDLADENSRSPNETRMRLVWQLDAGYPKPLVNQPVWDQQGRLLGYADILDPVAGVVGEFDGADHRGARRHSADVDREAGFRSSGLEFFRVTGPDLQVRSRVVARMASTRARAGWLVPGARQWSVVPPPTWAPAMSLDEILDERDLLRELHTQWERERDPGLNS